MHDRAALELQRQAFGGQCRARARVAEVGFDAYPVGRHDGAILVAAFAAQHPGGAQLVDVARAEHGARARGQQPLEQPDVHARVRAIGRQRALQR